MNRRFFLYGGGAAAAVAAAAVYGVLKGRFGVLSTSTPADAPTAALFALSLTDLQGRPHRLAYWKGRLMVVNFWSTWCGPCVKELPQFELLQKNYPQVCFIGIGVDTADNMRAFIRKTPVSYPLLVMDTGATDTLRALGNVNAGLPFTLVLNTDGHIEQSVVGPVNFPKLAQVLSRLSA
jgi:thiol-disulfide isomerase/thioredoxin